MATDGTISAVQHIRRMRGGSQAHLMRASDGCFYVVKFQNNPQHIRVLANEFLGSRLAQSLGLPTPEVGIIDVPEWLVAQSPELKVETAGMYIPCNPGVQFASRFVADPWKDLICDHLPETVLSTQVANRTDFVQMLAFDKWTGNCDGRQVVFTKHADEHQYRVTFIDQGYCFNAAEWTFPDLPLHGVYYRNHVYHDVKDWYSFEPTLTRIEMMEYADLWRCAANIPPDWFEYDGEGLFELMEALYERRSLVRRLITKFGESPRNPFPRWTRETCRTDT